MLVVSLRTVSIFGLCLEEVMLTPNHRRDAIFFHDQPGTSLRQADEIIFGHWDDYADQVIRVLHLMIKQTEELVFPNDEYTDLVRTFQAFPHRPNLSIVLKDSVYNEHECVEKLQTKQACTPAQKVWLAWATRVEEIHEDLAEKMSHCKLQLSKQHEEDFGLANLSLSSDLPKTESLTGLLHKILDSSSEPDEELENPQTGLEARMQLMGFCQQQRSVWDQYFGLDFRCNICIVDNGAERFHDNERESERMVEEIK